MFVFITLLNFNECLKTNIYSQSNNKISEDVFLVYLNVTLNFNERFSYGRNALDFKLCLLVCTRSQLVIGSIRKFRICMTGETV